MSVCFTPGEEAKSMHSEFLSNKGEEFSPRRREETPFQGFKTGKGF
jgi:hypothetical protein